jgi:hypothetical protein
VGRRYPLVEAADAVAALTDGSTSGRIVLTM